MSRLNSATHLWPEEDLDRLRLMTVIVAEREEWYALGLPCPVTWEGRGGAERKGERLSPSLLHSKGQQPHETLVRMGEA